MDNLFGREVLYSDVDVIDRSNVIDVLNSIDGIHTKNKTQIDYLYRYYKGEQPILRRKKDIRPEICNRIVENRAQEIVAFDVGYLCGEPIQYISRSTDGNVSKSIGVLNDMMLVENKAMKDKSLVEWQKICGTAYRIVLTGEDGAPFEIHTLDPRNAGVIRSSKIGNKALAGIYYGTDHGEIVKSVYTPNYFYEIRDGKITKEIPHILGGVPIIEYPANNARLGAFEPVISILDAINTVASNRIDGIEQFVQSLIKFINCGIDKETFSELLQLGAIQISSIDGGNADVDIMTQELNQTQTQTLVDYMYQTVLTICGMPNRNGNGSSTSDTGAASLLRDGWTLAEARAKDSELMFKASEREMLKIVLRICQYNSTVSLDLRDIDIKFTRRNYENIQTKAQVLCEMLNNPKIDPRLAFAHSGMFADPEEAYQASMKWYEEQSKKVETAKPLKYSREAEQKPDNKAEKPEIPN